MRTSQILHFVGSASAGAVLAATTFTFMMVWSQHRLAVDEANERQQEIIVAKQFGIVGPSSGPTTSGFTDYETIEIVLQEPILEYVDFGLSLKFSTKLALNGNSRRGALLGLDDLKPTPVTSCDDKVPPKIGAVVSCTQFPPSSRTTAEIRWLLHPTDARTHTALLDLKQAFDDAEILAVEEKIANLPDRVQLVFGKQQTYADSKTPFANAGEAKFDFENMTLSFPIEIRKSIGLTRTQYDRVSLFGSFIAFLLGTGAVWKVIEWYAKRRDEPPSQNDAGSSI